MRTIAVIAACVTLPMSAAMSVICILRIIRGRQSPRDALVNGIVLFSDVCGMITSMYTLLD